MALLELWAGPILSVDHKPICEVSILSDTISAGSLQDCRELHLTNECKQVRKEELISNGYALCRIAFKGGHDEEWVNAVRHLSGFRPDGFFPEKRRIHQAFIGRFAGYLYPAFMDCDVVEKSAITKETTVEYCFKLDHPAPFSPARLHQHQSSMPHNQSPAASPGGRTPSHAIRSSSQTDRALFSSPAAAQAPVLPPESSVVLQVPPGAIPIIPPPEYAGYAAGQFVDQRSNLMYLHTVDGLWFQLPGNSPAGYPHQGYSQAGFYNPQPHIPYGTWTQATAPAAGPNGISFDPELQPPAKRAKREMDLDGTGGAGGAPSVPTICVNPTFLASNAQNHAGWLFGGLAELSDNSYDARAKNFAVHVRDLRGQLIRADLDSRNDVLLLVEDDGEGMDAERLARMLSVGHAEEADLAGGRIGQYGVGFKSGAMRLGKDAIVLTKRLASSTQRQTASVAMLSQTLNAGAKSITVPMLTLTWPDLAPDMEVNSLEAVDAAWSLMEKGSPFTRGRLLYEMGNMYSGVQGTKIIIWNLSRDESTGQCELEADVDDLLIRGRQTRPREGAFDDAVAPLDYSLRAYLSHLYLRPKMNIIVQKKRILADSKQTLLERMTSVELYEKEFERGKATLVMGECQEEQERHNCGVHYYHKKRLIWSYKRAGLAQHGSLAFGVVGVLTAQPHTPDKTFLKVLNNKQDYHLDFALGEVQRWVEIMVALYWEHRRGVSMVPAVEREGALDSQAANLAEMIQCDNPQCGKWRRLERLPADTDAKWYCWQNPDKRYNSCHVPQDPTIDEDVTLAVRHGQRVVLGHEHNAGTARGERASDEEDGTNVSEPYPLGRVVDDSKPGTQRNAGSSDRAASNGRIGASVGIAPGRQGLVDGERVAGRSRPYPSHLPTTPSPASRSGPMLSRSPDPNGLPYPRSDKGRGGADGNRSCSHSSDPRDARQWSGSGIGGDGGGGRGGVSGRADRHRSRDDRSPPPRRQGDRADKLVGRPRPVR